MPSKQIALPLPDVVPERDSLIVRPYAEHLKGVGLSDGTTRMLISSARHIAVWPAREGSGLDTFDIRLLDRFMRHECLCLGRHRTGRKPGRQRRKFVVRFRRRPSQAGCCGATESLESGIDSLESNGNIIATNCLLDSTEASQIFRIVTQHARNGEDLPRFRC